MKNIVSLSVVLAVPTAHIDTVEDICGLLEAIYCPNIGSGFGFAVADA